MAASEANEYECCYGARFPALHDLPFSCALDLISGPRDFSARKFQGDTEHHTEGFRYFHAFVELSHRFTRSQPQILSLNNGVAQMGSYYLSEKPIMKPSASFKMYEMRTKRIGSATWDVNKLEILRL